MLMKMVLSGKPVLPRPVTKGKSAPVGFGHGMRQLMALKLVSAFIGFGTAVDFAEKSARADDV